MLFNLMIAFYCVVGWAVLGCIGFHVRRWDMKTRLYGIGWTRKERREALGVSFLGPFCLVMVLMDIGDYKQGRTGDGDPMK
jgi:hypothetical protein